MLKKNVAFVGLLLSLITVAVAAAQKTEPPEPEPLAKVDFPAYEKKVLPNGLTVYALEYREQPVLALRLVLAAGSKNDPTDLAGVASFTADLLNKGTQKRTATQIAQTIDQVGGSLEASADMESTVVSAGVLKDDVALAFELMTDIVMNPLFSAEELARVQQQAVSSLEANMEDPEFIADAAFQRAIYGSHPYAHLEGGTVNSIPGIKREDLVEFHRTYYAPNTSALAIVGDLSSGEAFKLAEEWFGSWKLKKVPASLETAIPRLQGRRIIVIDKPDSVQTEIRLGHTMVGRKDPEYFPLLVSSYVLGGSASGRLNQLLRVDRGLTYGAFTTIQPRKGPGSFYSVTETRTEKTGEALNLIIQEIERFRSAEVPALELKNSKAFIIGSFPLSLELPSDLASRLTTVFLYELGDDYLKTYRDKLAAVSASDMLRVAKARVSAQDAAIVLVGKAYDFVKDLEALGEVEVIPITEVNLDSPSLR